MSVRVGSLVLVAVLGIGGCSGGSSASTGTTSITTTVTAPAETSTTTVSVGSALPATLVGTWKVMLDAGDGLAIQKIAPGFAATGTWELDLTPRTFEMVNPEQFTAGAYAIGITSNTELSVVDDPQCPGQTATTGGRYTFSVSGDTLTLTSVVDDACPFRQGVLTAHPWKRSGAATQSTSSGTT